MRRFFAAILLVVWATVPAEHQVFDFVNLDRLNRKLRGRVVDFTENHGADRRIYSPILGRPRDLYVYLPPATTQGSLTRWSYSFMAPISTSTISSTLAI